LWERLTVTPELAGYAENVPGLGPLRRGFDPKIQSVHVFDENRLVVNILGDSTFLLDLKLRAATPCFHPGGGIVTTNGSELAIIPTVIPIDRPTSSGRRCYLVRPHQAS
jgi:hypothetical protein